MQICVKDCSRFSDENKLSDIGISMTECACSAGFLWHTEKEICSKDCSEIANARENVGETTDSCACLDEFDWKSESQSCEGIPKSPSCDDIPYAEGPTGDNCICANKFFWTGSACQIDCSLIENTEEGNPGIARCDCKKGYRWLKFAKVCVSNRKCEERRALAESGVN